MDAAQVIESDGSGRQASLAEIAYDRIEDLIVHRILKPGADVRMQELQVQIGIGRTPVHQAVRRLAAETLIQIRPRDGLRISPIDLTRDRRLLQLRRDMDRFVVRLAATNASGNIRNQMLHIAHQLRSRRTEMELEEFNTYDRLLDRTLMDAADEPFLDRTLRPLHTVSRRIGGLHFSEIGGREALLTTIDRHLDLVDPVLRRDVDAALAASDRLIDFADSMFDELEAKVDPALLDVQLGTFGKSR